MPNNPASTLPTDPWRQAHETAHALHDALRQLGISETVLGPLTARQDATGVHRVVVPPLPLEAVERLLTALGPALGPHSERARPLPVAREILPTAQP